MPLNQSFLLAATNGYLATLPPPYSPVAVANPTILTTASAVTLQSLLGIKLANTLAINHVQNSGLVRIGSTPTTSTVWTDDWAVPPLALGTLIGQDSWVNDGSAGVVDFTVNTLSAPLALVIGEATAVTPVIAVGGILRVSRPVTSTAFPFSLTYLVYFPSLMPNLCHMHLGSGTVAGDTFACDFRILMNTGVVDVIVNSVVFPAQFVLAPAVLHTLTILTDYSGNVSYQVDGGAVTAVGAVEVGNITQVSLLADDTIAGIAGFAAGDVWVSTGTFTWLDISAQGFEIADGTGIQFSTHTDLSQIYVWPRPGNGINSQLNLLAVGV